MWCCRKKHTGTDSHGVKRGGGCGKVVERLWMCGGNGCGLYGLCWLAIVSDAVSSVSPTKIILTGQLWMKRVDVYSSLA